MAEILQAQFDSVDETQDLGNALKTYESIIKDEDFSDEVIKLKEKSIYRLGQVYCDKQLFDELIGLIKDVLPLLKQIPSKSKTAKIVRTLFDYTTKFEGMEGKLISLCQHIVEWCDENKRTFLRHRIQTKLAELMFKNEQFHDALELLDQLLKEMKKLDDKQMLVEIQLIESQVFHALENIPKAKASLTSVKTASHAIYIQPIMQAKIDMQSGVISAEEKDYTTSFSYFFEGFEGYNSLKDKTAGKALKYMLMSKIMAKFPEDCLNLINSSSALNFQGPDVEAMKEVAKAVKDQNLLAFQKAKEDFKEELQGDNILKTHIQHLYDTLLEDNLAKIIEPYSAVQIEFVAKEIGLDIAVVQSKLSEMILDSKIDGTLDYGKGENNQPCLIIFDEVESNKAFDQTLGLFNNLEGVMNSLYSKTQQLSKEAKKKEEKKESDDKKEESKEAKK